MKKYIIAAAIVAITAVPLLTSADVTTLPSQAACTDITINLHVKQNVSDPVVKAQVMNLQQILMKEGFTVDSSESGMYGDSTKAAVKAFQEKYKDDVLAPVGLKKGTGNVGAVTRLKLQALYGCRKSSVMGTASLAVTSMVLDGNGVTATFCNNGKNDLTTAPFRIRLNGINRDFEVLGAQKAGNCDTEAFGYGTWGLTYGPGNTYGAVAIIDPNGVYKTGNLQYPLTSTSSLTVPAVPGYHLSARSILLQTTGVQATFCNLGTIDLSSFPVSVTVNGTTKSFDIPGAYKAGQCQTTKWTYDNWGITYTPGTIYSATVVTDPKNAYNETDEFDNVATIVGTP
jgi:peptidoglycan hydrolase-like protein with peptidoglycan-binding domain